MAILTVAELKQQLNITDDLGSDDDALRYEQELLNEAQQAGIDLTPAQIENIRRLATEMATAEEQTRRLATSQQELRRSVEEFGQQAKSVVGGFISDLQRGVSASDALKNALGRIADMMLDGALNALFGGGGVGGGGIFGSLFSSLLSFDGGGHTGNGARSGGVDGKGGFPAILHPRETIVDHTRSRSSPQNTTPQTVNIRVDVSGARGNAEIQDMVSKGVREGIQRYDRTQAGQTAVKAVRSYEQRFG